VARVRVIVEGQTEESFVGSVLAPTLYQHEVYLTPILLGVPGHKGGRPNYARVKKDILLHLRQDQTAYCSTMLDFYGLGPDFPGVITPAMTNAHRAKVIEDAIKEDICAEIPEFRPDQRLLPYIQLHEYEGLLFSDPQTFATSISQGQLATGFQAVRDGFATPEDINDDPTTAPSKRILRAYPSYRKVIHSTIGAQAVGIQRMREECPRFRAWLEQLEALTPIPTTL
jgi:hypothetical protein